MSTGRYMQRGKRMYRYRGVGRPFGNTTPVRPSIEVDERTYQGVRIIAAQLGMTKLKPVMDRLFADLPVKGAP